MLRDLETYDTELADLMRRNVDLMSTLKEDLFGVAKVCLICKERDQAHGACSERNTAEVSL